MSRLIFLLLLTALFQPAPAKGRSHAPHRAHKASRPSAQKASRPTTNKASRPTTHKVQRTSAARTALRHKNPCPGYVIDHKQALKRGGPDTPENMQWQTTQAAKAKDRIE